jgi:hypothetical protein
MALMQKAVLLGQAGLEFVAVQRSIASSFAHLLRTNIIEYSCEFGRPHDFLDAEPYDALCAGTASRCCRGS